MSKTPYKAVCVWPDGQRRDVMVISVVDQMANIIWNEKMTKITGFDETVPLVWIKK